MSYIYIKHSFDCSVIWTASVEYCLHNKENTNFIISQFSFYVVLQVFFSCV